MKKFSEIDRYKDRFESVLSKTSDVEEAFSIISSIYTDLLADIPLLKPFKVELVNTETLRYQVFYEASPDISAQSIVITNTNYDAYLWFDFGEWYLDDDNLTVHEIASNLCSSQAFESIPENVRDLKSLIDNGIWIFDASLLPSFSGDKPEDTREVLSWDSKHILAGTDIKNFVIMSREEWSKMCDRENNWFNGGNA